MDEFKQPVKVSKDVRSHLKFHSLLAKQLKHIEVTALKAAITKGIKTLYTRPLSSIAKSQIPKNALSVVSRRSF